MILLHTSVEISVVVPAHDEAENLPTLIDEIVSALEPLGRSFEIVIVDDASSDDSWSVLERLGDRVPQLRPRRLRRQSGQSAALSAGFDVAEGSIIVTLDADLQNDPADIPALLERIGEADVAIGWRKDRRDVWTKKIVSRFANRVRNSVTSESVRDTGCGLKAFKAECLERIPRFNGMHRFFPTLVKIHGYHVVEEPVHHRPRTKGKTHYGLKNRFLGPIADLLAVRWLQARSLRYELIEERALVRR